jgi:acetoin utilization deacetylase AcuC-like enzyme
MSLTLLFLLKSTHQRILLLRIASFSSRPLSALPRLEHPTGKVRAALDTKQKALSSLILPPSVGLVYLTSTAGLEVSLLECTLSEDDLKQIAQRSGLRGSGKGTMRARVRGEPAAIVTIRGGTNLARGASDLHIFPANPWALQTEVLSAPAFAKLATTSLDETSNVHFSQVVTVLHCNAVFSEYYASAEPSPLCLGRWLVPQSSGLSNAERVEQGSLGAAAREILSRKPEDRLCDGAFITNPGTGEAAGPHFDSDKAAVPLFPTGDGKPQLSPGMRRCIPLRSGSLYIPPAEDLSLLPANASCIILIQRVVMAEVQRGVGPTTPISPFRLDISGGKPCMTKLSEADAKARWDPSSTDSSSGSSSSGSSSGGNSMSDLARLIENDRPLLRSSYRYRYVRDPVDLKKLSDRTRNLLLGLHVIDFSPIAAVVAQDAGGAAAAATNTAASSGLAIPTSGSSAPAGPSGQQLLPTLPLASSSNTAPRIRIKLRVSSSSSSSSSSSAASDLCAPQPEQLEIDHKLASIDPTLIEKAIGAQLGMKAYQEGNDALTKLPSLSDRVASSSASKGKLLVIAPTDCLLHVNSMRAVQSGNTKKVSENPQRLKEITAGLVGSFQVSKPGPDYWADRQLAVMGLVHVEALMSRLFKKAVKAAPKAGSSRSSSSVVSGVTATGGSGTTVLSHFEDGRTLDPSEEPNTFISRGTLSALTACLGTVRELVTTLAVTGRRYAGYALIRPPSHHASVDQNARASGFCPMATLRIMARELSVALHTVGFSRPSRKEAMRQRMQYLVWLFLVGSGYQESIISIENSKQTGPNGMAGTHLLAASAQASASSSSSASAAADSVIRPQPFICRGLREAGLADRLDALRADIDAGKYQNETDDSGIIQRLKQIVLDTVTDLKRAQNAVGRSVKGDEIWNRWLALTARAKNTFAYLTAFCERFPPPTEEPDGGRPRIGTFDLDNHNGNGTQEAIRALASHLDLIVQHVVTGLDRLRHFSSLVSLEALFATEETVDGTKLSKPRLAAAAEAIGLTAQSPPSALTEDTLRGLLKQLSGKSQVKQEEVLRFASDVEALIWKRYHRPHAPSRKGASSSGPEIWKTTRSSSELVNAKPASSASSASSSSVAPVSAAAAPVATDVGVNYLAMTEGKAPSLMLDHHVHRGLGLNPAKRLALAGSTPYTFLSLIDDGGGNAAFASSSSSTSSSSTALGALTERRPPLKALGVGKTVTARFGALPSTHPSLASIPDEVGARVQAPPAVDINAVYNDAVLDTIIATAKHYSLTLTAGQLSSLAGSGHKDYKEHSITVSFHEAAPYDEESMTGFGTWGTDAFGTHYGAAGTRFFFEPSYAPISLGSDAASSSNVGPHPPTITPTEILCPLWKPSRKPTAPKKSPKGTSAAAKAWAKNAPSTAARSPLDEEAGDVSPLMATDDSEDETIEVSHLSESAAIVGLPSSVFFPPSDASHFLVSHSSPAYRAGADRVPLGESRAAFWDALHAYRSFKPDFDLFGFGLDQLYDDQLGGQKLTVSDQFRMVMEIAAACPQTVGLSLLQEGGYGTVKNDYRTVAAGAYAACSAADIIAEIKAKGEGLAWTGESKRVPGVCSGLVELLKARKDVRGSSSGSGKGKPPAHQSSLWPADPTDEGDGSSAAEEDIKGIFFNHLMNAIVSRGVAAATAATTAASSLTSSSSSAAAAPVINPVPGLRMAVDDDDDDDSDDELAERQHDGLGHENAADTAMEVLADEQVLVDNGKPLLAAEQASAVAGASHNENVLGFDRSQQEKDDDEGDEVSSGNESNGDHNRASKRRRLMKSDDDADGTSEDNGEDSALAAAMQQFDNDLELLKASKRRVQDRKNALDTSKRTLDDAGVPLQKLVAEGCNLVFEPRREYLQSTVAAAIRGRVETTSRQKAQAARLLKEASEQAVNAKKALVKKREALRRALQSPVAERDNDGSAISKEVVKTKEDAKAAGEGEDPHPFLKGLVDLVTKRLGLEQVARENLGTATKEASAAQNTSFRFGQALTAWITADDSFQQAKNAYEEAKDELEKMQLEVGGTASRFLDRPQPIHTDAAPA